MKVRGRVERRVFFGCRVCSAAVRCAGCVFKGDVRCDAAQILVAADGVDQGKVEMGLKKRDFIPPGVAFAMAFPDPGTVFEGKRKRGALLLAV